VVLQTTCRGMKNYDGANLGEGESEGGGGNQELTVRKGGRRSLGWGRQYRLVGKRLLSEGGDGELKGNREK